MTEKDFRRIVLALDGAIEGAHMGHPHFRAHGRIFATLRAAPKADLTRSGSPIFGVLMLTRQQQQHFLTTSRAFAPESGAWGQAGSTRVRLKDVDAETLGEAVTLAWQNATAKASGHKNTAAKRKPAGRTRQAEPRGRSAAARKRARG